MTATLSVLGLYKYDDTIFENLVLPEGVDPQIAVDSILFDNAELEIMYPNPEWIKELIGVWSTRELPIWERILNAVNKDYNPIENYNRTETITQTDTGVSTANASNTDTHKVTGYNSGAFVDQFQDSGIASTSGNSTLSTSRSSNIKGNIGVTTSQEMLNQELDVVKRLDIYKYISDSFKNRFCLMVY
ncbi:MAG: hypothetical protein J6U97_06765 [Bacteroidaceae bacterium]|nr:hypothetical protein [Bacteroidaceae bacterium]